MFPPRRCTCLGVALTTLACSNDTTAPTETPTTSAVKTLTPAGGEIEIQTTAGARVTLAFPEGSLRSAEEIRLTALAGVGASWLQVAVEPAGVALDRPLVVTVSVPTSAPLDAGTSLHFGTADAPVFITTDVDLGARTLMSSLAILGFPDRGDAPVDRDALGGTVATLGASPAVCAARRGAAQGALDIFLEARDYARALQYYDAYTALAEADSCDIDHDAFIATARPVVCEAYAGAVTAAQVVAVDDFDTLYAIVGALVYWFGEATVMAADCVDVAEFFGILDEKFEQFLVFYNPQLEGIDVEDIELFQKLRDEARDVYRLYVEATHLGLDDAAGTLKTERFDPLLHAIRSVGYARCRSHDDHYFLTKVTWTGFWSGQDVLPGARVSFDAGQQPARPSGVTSAGLPFSDEEIFADIHQCASCARLTSVNAFGVELGEIELGGGDEPDNAETEGSLSVDPSGTLRLSGDVKRLVCFPPSVNAGDYLDIALDGTSVATVPATDHRDLLHDNIELDVAELFETLGDGVPVADDTFTMTVHRHRDTCSDALFGASPYKLFEVTLEIGDDSQPDDIDILVTEWTTTATEERVPLGFRTNYLRDGEIIGTAAGINVEIDVDGGSTKNPEGVTSAGGTYQTIVSLVEPVVQVMVRVSDGQLEAVQELSVRQAIVLPDINLANVRARAWDDTGPEKCDNHEDLNAEIDDFDGWADSVHEACDDVSDASASVNLELTYSPVGDLTKIHGRGAATARGNRNTYAWANADFAFWVYKPVSAHMSASLDVAGDTFSGSFGLEAGVDVTYFAWEHTEGSSSVNSTVALEPGWYRVRAHYRADGGRGKSGTGDNYNYTLTLTPVP